VHTTAGSGLAKQRFFDRDSPAVRDFSVTLGFRGVIEQLADDVTDGEDVEHVGAHLDVGIDEAAVYDSYACFISGDFLPLGDLLEALLALQHCF
jgi:hypothetical protein